MTLNIQDLMSIADEHDIAFQPRITEDGWYSATVRYGDVAGAYYGGSFSDLVNEIISAEPLQPTFHGSQEHDDFLTAVYDFSEAVAVETGMDVDEWEALRGFSDEEAPYILEVDFENSAFAERDFILV